MAILRANNNTLSSVTALPSGVGGGLVFISGVTLSNVASTAFTGIDSTYETYIFMLNNVVPATDNVVLYMRTSTDGGSSYDSSAGNYGWSYYRRGSGGANNGASASDTEIELAGTDLGIGSDTGEGLSGTITLYNPSDSGLYTYVSTELCYNDTTSGSINTYPGAGARLATADVDAVQFLMSSGNLESGEINMYGVVKS